MTSHDADEVIGRIRNDGGWDRRYSIRSGEPLPSPVTWCQILNIAALTVYVIILFGSILFLAAFFALGDTLPPLEMR
jgi:hypothetical protein